MTLEKSNEDNDDVELPRLVVHPRLSSILLAIVPTETSLWILGQLDITSVLLDENDGDWGLRERWFGLFPVFLLPFIIFLN